MEDDTEESDVEGYGALRSYDEVVNHLLATYAYGSTIYATTTAINDLKNRENQEPIAFKDDIFVQTSRCGKVYGQSCRLNLFFQYLNENIRNKALHYYAVHPKATLHSLNMHVN